MWRKLLSDQDIDSISEGNIIIKYPIDGEPQQEIDLSSEEIFMLYEVCRVTGAEVLLQVPAEDQREEMQRLLPGNFHEAVCLSRKELLLQKVWWIK